MLVRLYLGAIHRSETKSEAEKGSSVKGGIHTTGETGWEKVRMVGAGSLSSESAKREQAETLIWGATHAMHLGTA